MIANARKASVRHALLGLAWITCVGSDAPDTSVRIIPEDAFEIGDVEPIRTEDDYERAQYRRVLFPVAFASTAFPGEAWPIAVIEMPAYRYDPYMASDGTSNPLAVMQEFADGLLSEEILPAASDVFAGSDEVTLRPIEAIISANTGATAYVPVEALEIGDVGTVSVDFGFFNSLAATAWADIILGDVFEAETGTIEQSRAFQRYLLYVSMLYLSESHHRRTQDRFFDYGYVEVLFPTDDLTPLERWEYFTSNVDLARLLLAHEACHILLGHTDPRSSLSRRKQELTADSCALAIFHRIRSDQLDNRTSDFGILYDGALKLSFLSQLVWPDEETDQYPLPSERYRNLIETRYAFDKSDFIERPSYFSEPYLPIDDDRLLSLRSLRIPTTEVDPQGNRSNMLLELLEELRADQFERCLPRQADCETMLTDGNLIIRYEAVKRIVSLASAEADLLRRGQPPENLAQSSAWLRSARAVNATDGFLDDTVFAQMCTSRPC